jgi:ribulose-bisphosphate carboxylase large chain
LLNLLYGNISIKKNIRLAGLDISEALLDDYPGPAFGIEGFRHRLGVYERPLLATAIKPRGASIARLADIAYGFALGGGDLIKDDHNFAEADFDSYRRRVEACHEAVACANAETGRACHYVPNAIVPLDQLERHLSFCANLGVGGVMVSPGLMGFDALRVASRKYGLPVLAHPTFTGTFYRNEDHGIAPAVYLGMLMRLAGADASIYPNYGGRFSLTREECMDTAEALRGELGGLAPAWPAPAGGMRFGRIAEMASEYGRDTLFLIGGALLSHSDDLAKSTADFLAAIRENFGEHLEEPAEFASACEMPLEKGADILPHAPFNAERFAWAGREPAAYKSEGALPFSGVTRHELIGKHGEETAFDLRYFELDPGGYTSYERHRHTHTIVAMRGEGVLIRNGARTKLRPHDLAYVAPLEPHQLVNESAAPFGFFCIVDHERDRPQAP